MLYSWHQSAWHEVRGRRDNFPHAVLLHGPQGIGRSGFALALAQSLICAAPQPDRSACGECEHCNWFAQGCHPDFRDVQPEVAEEGGEQREKSEAPAKRASTQITIEQIRTLRDFLGLTSGGATRQRVVVLRPAEALNAHAANALLKMLEEPPAGANFILVATAPRRLLPTVVSRCRKVALPAPSRFDALAWLAAQGQANADLLLGQAGGAPLRALRAADPAYQQARTRFLDALAGLDSVAAVLGLAASLTRAPLDNVLHWIATWCDDLARRQCGGEVRYNLDYRAAIERLAARIAAAPLFAHHAAILATLRSAAHPLNQQLVLEQLLLSYWQLARAKPSHD